MSVADDINRIFREFNRYTGDGLPGAPSNAPLPIGDPQSGVYHPRKAELRGVLSSILIDGAAIRQEVEEAVREAEAARDVAVSAAGTNLVNFASRDSAAEANIPPMISYVLTAGYAAPGDDGRAFYRKVDTEPTHDGKFQSADGAWWELTEMVVTPAMLGAAGDGATNDAAAIQAAIGALPKGGILDGHGKTYRVDTSLTLKGDIALQNITFDYSNAPNTTAPLLVAMGSMGASLPAAVAAVAGAQSLAFTGAGTSGWAPGDYIWLESTTLWDTGDDNTTMGELHKVKSISGDTVTFYDPILYAMPMAGLTGAKVNFIENITLQNVTARGNGLGATGNHYGMHARFVSNLRVNNCKFTHFDDRNFFIWRCLDPHFTGNYIGHSNKTSLSYCITFCGGCYGAKAIGNTFVDARHGVDFGDRYGVNRFAVIEGNVCLHMREAGMSTHTAADHVIFANNIIECDPNLPVGGGIVIRSPNTKLIGNRIINPGTNGIQYSVNAKVGGTVEIINNEIIDMAGASTGILVRKNIDVGAVNSVKISGNTIVGRNVANSQGVWVRAITAHIDYVSITDNTIDNIKRGVFVEARGSNVIGMVTVANNIMDASGGGLEAIYLTAETDGYINDITVTGNQCAGGYTYGVRASNEENIIITSNNVRNATNKIVTTASNIVNANNLV